jgi:hypothetical protein
MNIIESQDGPGIVITSDWTAHSRGLREHYPLLSDNDLHYEPGKEAEMLCRIETRLNKTREEVIQILQKEVIVVS